MFSVAIKSRIKVLKSGRWAVPGKPWLPQVEVVEGQELTIGEDIDLETASAMYECGKAELAKPNFEVEPDEDPEAVEVPREPEIETKPAVEHETKPKGKRGRRAAK
jgi:hypothetical protein